MSPRRARTGWVRATSEDHSGSGQTGYFGSGSLGERSTSADDGAPVESPGHGRSDADVEPSGVPGRTGWRNRGDGKQARPSRTGSSALAAATGRWAARSPPSVRATVSAGSADSATQGERDGDASVDRIGRGDSDALFEAGDAAPLAAASAVDPLFGPLELIAPVESDRAAAITVRGEERPEAPSVDGQSWLEAALAELDRVWGRPLPDLDASHHAPDPTCDAAADVAAEGPAAGLVAEGPAAGLEVGGPAADPAAGLAADTAAEGVAAAPGVGRDAVGCVVTVDVVRAGAQVRDRELLNAVGERLDGLLPAGTRLRFEADGSAVSVVLPGRARSDATEWMHRTLPAVFADVAGIPRLARPTGTSLRAAPHDTEGPVGAQLLQRLDLGTARAGARRARQDDIQPPLTVRWGVPIRAGSGGRRRRAYDVTVVDEPTTRPGGAVARTGGRHRQHADGSAGHRLDDDADAPRAEGDRSPGVAGGAARSRTGGDGSAGAAGSPAVGGAGSPASRGRPTRGRGGSDAPARRADACGPRRVEGGRGGVLGRRARPRRSAGGRAGRLPRHMSGDRRDGSPTDALGGVRVGAAVADAMTTVDFRSCM